MKKIYKAVSVLLLLAGLTGCKGVAKQMEEKKVEQSTMSSSKETATQETQIRASDSSNTTSAIGSYAAGSLLQAVEENNVGQIRMILQSTDYPIDEVNSRQETSLLIAVHNNQIEAAELLIDRGADINQQDEIQDSPYLYAGAQGRTEILSYMLAHGEPDQQKVNRFGGNALIPAAEKGHLANVRLLLEDGRTNINHQNNFGYTALIEAVALRDGSEVYQQIVQTLLAAGADKALRDNFGKTAEDYAIELGYTRILQLLQGT